LGSYHHSTFYIQEFVEKPGRDIRVFVVGGETICAIARHSDHWITNTARGGKAVRFEVTPKIEDLGRRVSDAVGGGVLGIDLLERPSGDVLVNEVNYTIEFRNSIEPTGVNIPGKIVDFTLDVASGKRKLATILNPAATVGATATGSAQEGPASGGPAFSAANLAEELAAAPRTGSPATEVPAAAGGRP